jgi:hypothetical protein
MRNEGKVKTLSAVAALLVLAVFALTILGVLLGGAGVYRRLTQHVAASADSRSAAQYLATKVRQAPLPGQIQVLPFGEGLALQIPETENGAFVTRIYCHDGWLMELFCAEGSDLLPQDGEKVLPMERLTPSLEAGLLKLSITDSRGQTQELLLTLRGEVARP